MYKVTQKVFALRLLIHSIHRYDSYASYVATNYLFISSARVHLTKFSPIFASFQQKCLDNFFRCLGGAVNHVHSLATPMFLVLVDLVPTG